MALSYRPPCLCIHSFLLLIHPKPNRKLLTLLCCRRIWIHTLLCRLSQRGYLPSDCRQTCVKFKECTLTDYCRGNLKEVGGTNSDLSSTSDCYDLYGKEPWLLGNY
jgi:hypothetical protein